MQFSSDSDFTSPTSDAPVYKSLSEMVDREGLRKVLAELKQVVLEKADNQIETDGLELRPSTLEKIASRLCSCEIDSGNL